MAATAEKKKGTTCEYMVAAYLASHGWDVFIPMGKSTKADLIVQKDEGGPLAVQVKSAYVSAMHDGYQFLQVRTEPHKYEETPYDIFFAVLRSDGRIWEIPRKYAMHFKTLYLDSGMRRPGYDPDDWLVHRGWWDGKNLR